MRRLLLTSAALHDLADVARFITRWSGTARTGHGFVRELRDHCASLARLPGTTGVARPALGPGVRATFHGNYVIVFRYETDALRVLRVTEGHRDVAREIRSVES